MTPEQDPNAIIKKYVEAGGPEGWEHAERMKWLYQMHDVVSRVWFSPKDETQAPIPQTVLGIDNLGVKTYAAFRLTYNANGLPNEIVLNRHYIDRPQWALMESLTHETIHLYQEYFAKKRHPGFYTCANTGHNRQFVAIAEEIGLHPKPGEGYHTRRADGQFERLMTIMGIEKPPEEVPGSDLPARIHWWDAGKPAAKGSSTLTLYTASDCPKPRPCKFRAGVKDLHVRCVDCDSPFKAEVGK